MHPMTLNSALGSGHGDWRVAPGRGVSPKRPALQLQAIPNELRSKLPSAPKSKKNLGILQKSEIA